MVEERLDRIEDMLTTLIKMVGIQNEILNGLTQEQAVMKEDMSDMKKDISNLKVDMSSMKNENTNRHAEVLNKLVDIQADQDFIWKKSASNERDLEKLKIRLGL